MTHRDDTSPAQLVMSAVLLLGRRLRAERPSDGVPISQLSALEVLSRLGPMPAARLAEMMRLQPQSLTRLIAGLEEGALIVRTPGEEDRRTILLQATRTGRAAVRRDLAARQAWLEKVWQEELTAAERSQLQAASTLMLRLANASSPGW